MKNSVPILLCSAMGFMFGSVANGQHPDASPVMPMKPMIWTLPSVEPATHTIHVHARDDLQRAIDAAEPGDVLLLDAGATWTGNFILRYKPGFDTDPRYVTIRTSTPDTLLPPNDRVTPGAVPLLAHLQSYNTVPVLRTEFKAHHYRLVGMEITKITDPANPKFADVSYGLIWVGGPNTSNRYPSQTSELPHHFITDRCYIHGDYAAPNGETYRGEMMNGAYVAVINSYISNLHSPYVEVQGLEVTNTNGPIKIVNNYVEAAGENIMFGGADPPLPNSAPADIEIRHNYLSKPLTWNPYDHSYAGVSYSVKNLLEFKNAHRVLVDGNIFEHNWVKAQDGKAVLFTPRNQSGGCPWCLVQDITFTNNVVRHTAGVFNSLACDYNFPSLQLQRLFIGNNLFQDIGGAEWGDTGDYGIFEAIGGSRWRDGPHCTELDVTFDHNTEFAPKNVIEAANAPAATRFFFTGNILLHGQYGIFGDAVGEGTKAMSVFLPDGVWRDNVMVGNADSVSNLYPARAFRWYGGIQKVGFSDAEACRSARGPITLCAIAKSRGQSDTFQPGANIDALAHSIECVESGKECN